MSEGFKVTSSDETAYESKAPITFLLGSTLTSSKGLHRLGWP